MSGRTGRYVLFGILVAEIALVGCSTSPQPVVAARPDVSRQTSHYVVLGSSIGTWWAKDYGRLIEADLSVSIVYHSYYVGNQSVEHLLQTVMQKEPLREDLKNADVVTIGCGFNDMHNAVSNYARGAYDRRRMREKVEAFGQMYESMVDEVLKLAPPSRTIIRMMDFYFPYVRRFKEEGNYDSIKRYWMQFNQCIVRTGRRKGIPVAQVFAAYNGSKGDDDPKDKGYIDSDGLHPSDLGKQVMAAQFRKLGYQWSRR